MLKEREEDHRRRNDGLERKNKELETDLNKLNGQVKIWMERAGGHRDSEETLKKFEVDCRTLTNQNKMLE